jgi:DNA-directed RNA polymerase subunit RPC12/RpoP
MSAALPSKEIVCDCGNRITSQQRSNWCPKCGRQVFYDPKDKLKGRINRIYITALMALIIGLVTYFFIELIVTPVLYNLK